MPDEHEAANWPPRRDWATSGRFDDRGAPALDLASPLVEGIGDQCRLGFAFAFNDQLLFGGSGAALRKSIRAFARITAAGLAPAED
jgi:hypothetical protein